VSILGDDLLGDQLRENPRDAAGHRLKRLPGDALVGLAHPPCQGDDQLGGDVAVSGDDPAHVRGR
jgi:hypothetical protein